MTASPRIVTVLLLVGLLALANRYAPGMVQAVLSLVVLYLLVTHAPQVNRTITRASADLSRSFRR